MKRILMTISAITFCGVMVISCASEYGLQGQPPSGGEGKSSAPETILMTLKNLTNLPTTQKSLAITTEQTTLLLPILKEWKSKSSTSSSADAKAYASGIKSVLTKEQLAYHPEIQQGNGSSGMGAPGGNPPNQGGGMPPSGQGGPGGNKFVSLLLEDIIKALSGS
ncbi:MAG TPA: hypothetical protein VN456_11695 [Desulfosporosinus sp.]|nr:hypothetical protein [Desulfosporosinus sp.]